MIDLSLSDLLGGEPVPVDIDDLPKQAVGPVYHVHLEGQPQKVFEKIVAKSSDEALATAKELLGDVDGMFVSGPHEHIMAKVEEPKAGADAGKAPE